MHISSWAAMTKRHRGRQWHCRTIRTFNLHYASCRKQRNGRTAGASTQGNGSAAATESRATCFHPQRRGGPLSACRRPLAIRRSIAASRTARMTIAASVRPWRRGSNDFRSWQILLQKSFWGGERKFLEPLIRFTRDDVRDHIVSSKIDHGPR